MNKFRFVIIGLVLFAVGMLILLSSVTWGHATANSYLRAQGGGMDSAQFTIIVQESINTYQWLGSILALIGGLGFIRTIDLE